MNTYKTIQIERKKSVVEIRLNRPEIHNAFNDKLITELTQTFRELEKDKEVSIIQMRGNGKSFSAGADLNWMKKMVNYDYKKNYTDSLQLAECLYAIYSSSKTTIALVHGNAIGGAVGLLATCDFVLAEEETRFALKEVKLGIIPACIAPYVVKRVGEYQAKDLMLTGRTIDADQALEIKLINQKVGKGLLGRAADKLHNSLLSGGTDALISCKKLINTVANSSLNRQIIEYTAEAIAKQRISEEGQEGMNAFLEKRKPDWIK